MINQLVLVGKIVRKPSTILLEKGNKGIQLELSVERTFKNEEGKYDTDYITIQVWGGLAENIESYAIPGTMMAFKGRLESKKGSDKIEIIIEKATFLTTSNLDKRG